MLAAQAATASGMPPPGLCQLMQLQEAAEAAAADSNEISDADGGDDDDEDDDASQSVRSSVKHATGSTPETMTLQPADADPFGLAELVAKTMCELESSPAKPRGFVRPERAEDEAAESASPVPSRLSRWNAAVPGEGRLTWDQAYSYCVGLGDAECTAPPGATVSVQYVQEAFFTVCGFWPGLDSHEDSARRLGLAEFRAFCKEAEKLENRRRELPAGYVLSRPEERAKAHAVHSAEHPASKDPAAGAEAATGEGDTEGRRQSPPIRCVSQCVLIRASIAVY